MLTDSIYKTILDKYTRKPEEQDPYRSIDPLPVDVLKEDITTPTEKPIETGTSPFFSPELEALKHSTLTRDYSAMPDYFQSIKETMGQLGQPLDTPIGMSDRERRAIYNLGRRQIQGGTKTAMEQMSERLAQRGFRAGESGIADTILANISREGAERSGRYATEIATEEAQRRTQEALQKESLNIQRMLGSGQLGKVLGDIESSRYAEGLGALSLGGGLEKFEKEFEHGAEMDIMDLMLKYYALQQQQQQVPWEAYWEMYGR